MADPVVYYTVNAQLDGVDTGSDNLQERMKFFVYQRRMLMDALKTKAMFLAMMGNGEAAAKAAGEYMEMAVPITVESKLEHQASLDARMNEIAKMAPLEAGLENGVVKVSRPTNAPPSFTHGVDVTREISRQQPVVKRK